MHDFEQIKPSVRNLNWLGLGRSIHMTVGGKDVLINCGDGVVDKYEVEPMRPFPRRGEYDSVS